MPPDCLLLAGMWYHKDEQRMWYHIWNINHLNLKGVFVMTTLPPIDMFGLPPMREDLNGFSTQCGNELPGWVTEEHYENCSTGASWLYKFFKK